ncbi:MAG: histidinol-phosphate transaminase [Nanoarchaeota archaeon]
MNPYDFHGGSSFDAIGSGFESLGSKEDIVRADVCDAPYDPCPEVIKVLKENLPWLVRNSPPIEPDGLVKAISQERCIPTDQIYVGAGSTRICHLLLETLDVKSAAVLDPMYNEYRRVLQDKLGLIVFPVFQDAKDGFRIDPEMIIHAAKDCGLVTIVNPNNPTGQYLKALQIETILQSIPMDTRFLVDEAYVECIGESVERLVPKYSNLIVMKTLSKSYALSGLRVGYLVADPCLVAKLKEKTPPWSISTPGILAAITAVRNQSYVNCAIKTAKEDARILMGELSSAGVEVMPSATYFFLVKLPRGRAAKEVCKRMAQKQAYVRDLSAQSAQNMDRYIRIAAKGMEVNKRILAAMEYALSV